MADAKTFEPGHGLVATLLCARSPRSARQCESHVVDCRQMGKKSEILGQVGKPALFGGTVDGQVRVEEDLVGKRDATAIRLAQAQDGQQQAGLARSIGTNQGQGLSAHLQCGLQ
jgi:hypothetical protein